MVDFGNLFHSIHFDALLIGLILFLFTVFLAIRGWITGLQTLLLLLFSLAAGTIINNQDYFRERMTSGISSNTLSSSGNHFQDQIVQALDNIRVELNYDRESLQHIMNQLDELFNQVDLQRRKVEHFIDDTRERLAPEPAKALAEPSAQLQK